MDGYTGETIMLQWIQMVLIYVPLVAGVVWVIWKAYQRCCNSETRNKYLAIDEDFPEEIFNRSEGNL